MFNIYKNLVDLYMNRLYLFSLIIPFILIASISNATILQNGYFSYQNFSIKNGTTLVVGYNTNTSADLLILNSVEFSRFENGSSFYPIYNKTVYGSHIFTLNLSPGAYYLVLSTINNQINYSLAEFTAPKNELHKQVFYNSYKYNIELSNYSRVGIVWISNNSMNIRATDYNFYNNQTSAISEWSNYYTMNRGSNNITFISNNPTEIYFYTNITSELVNPLNIANLSLPQPIGVVSYGLYNISGELVPYQINTSAIYGIANITDIYGYNKSPPTNTSINGASLQLNTVVNIVSNSGKVYTYWLQNVAEFNTSAKNYMYGDNIWNFTTNTANVNNKTLIGNGYFETYTQKNYNNTSDSVVVYAYPKYIYQNEVVSYNYPLFIAPIIKINYANGKPIISFGYESGNGWHYYDNVTFNIYSNNAHLLVTPYYETPSYHYYNSEFVFGGEGNGESTQFNQLNSSLWEYYYSNNTFIPFPSLFTFGGNTEETATNVKVIKSNVGARVLVGIPTYTTDIFIKNSTADITIPTSTTTTTIGYAYNNISSNNTISTTANNQMNNSAISPSQLIGIGNTNMILDGIIIALILGISLLVLSKVLKRN